MEAHVPNPLKIGKIQQIDLDVDWNQFQDARDWLKRQPIQEWRDFFKNNGYLEIPSVLHDSEVKIYREICRKMLEKEIDTSIHRHDLGNHIDRKVSETENICQIMWPGLYVKDISRGPLHERTKLVAKELLGDDVELDFDMIIAKSPHTETITPWHQDASYWPKFADTRACSVWVAMDEAVRENGCMWFVPGSHLKPLREHWRVGGKHLQQCEGSESEGVCVPLSPGGCTIHHGFTLHYTRGNTTDLPRRAYIVAYRPRDMIEFARTQGINHGKEGLGDMFEKNQIIDCEHGSK